MSLEFAILGFLSEQPASGYELKTRCFEGPVQSFWKADQAQIYRTLDKLEQQKYVSAEFAPQTKRPSKKIYSLTPTGREAFEKQLRMTPEPAAVRDPFALHVFFSNDLKPNELNVLFSSEIQEQSLRLNAIESELNELTKSTRSRSKKAQRKQTLKKYALEGIKMRILAEIEYKKSVLSELTNS